MDFEGIEVKQSKLATGFGSIETAANFQRAQDLIGIEGEANDGVFGGGGEERVAVEFLSVTETDQVGPRLAGRFGIGLRGVVGKKIFGRCRLDKSLAGKELTKISLGFLLEISGAGNPPSGRQGTGGVKENLVLSGGGKKGKIVFDVKPGGGFEGRLEIVIGKT